MTVPGPPPEPAPQRTPLEATLLEAIRREDDAAIAASLLADEVVIPAERPPETAANGETELALPVWTHGEQRYAVAFTSEAELRTGAPEAAGSIRLPGAAYFAALMPGLGFALNPGANFGVAFTAEDVDRLLREPARAAEGGAGGEGPGADAGGPGGEGGSGPPRAGAGTGAGADAGRPAGPGGSGPEGPPFQIGEPAEEDEELLDAARAAARRRPQIRELRRALLLVLEEGREPALVVGVELEPGTADPAALLDELLAELPERAALAPIGPDVDNPISAYMRQETAPFYVRAGA